jgi:NifU-like N terminal domain
MGGARARSLPGEWWRSTRTSAKLAADVGGKLVLEKGADPKDLRKALKAAAGSLNRRIRFPFRGDRETMFVRLEEDVMKEVGFRGAGCAISTASASMMTESAKGKTRGSGGSLRALPRPHHGAGRRDEAGRARAREARGLLGSARVSRAGQVRDPAVAHPEGCPRRRRSHGLDQVDRRAEGRERRGLTCGRRKKRRRPATSWRARSRPGRSSRSRRGRVCRSPSRRSPSCREPRDLGTARREDDADPA